MFRSYFDTQLLIAKSKGKITHDFRVFFMGHKGNMEARYTTNKSVLVEALVNEIRETFKRCEEFLDIEIKKEDPLMKQKKAAKITIDNATPEQIQRIQAIMGISV
ncbi:MAG: hypothetical protein EX285_08735 [Thaumarchaeota archaeon]|nr:hypothetical protein [Nitrososphaerota archaeon]